MVMVLFSLLPFFDSLLPDRADILVWTLFKKKLFMTLAKDSGEDFVQVGYTMSFCSRRDMGLNSKYNKEKSGLIAKKQRRGSVDGKLLRCGALLP